MFIILALFALLSKADTYYRIGALDESTHSADVVYYWKEGSCAAVYDHFHLFDGTEEDELLGYLKLVDGSEGKLIKMYQENTCTTELPLVGDAFAAIFNKWSTTTIDEKGEEFDVKVTSECGYTNVMSFYAKEKQFTVGGKTIKITSKTEGGDKIWRIDRHDGSYVYSVEKLCAEETKYQFDTLPIASGDNDDGDDSKVQYCYKEIEATDGTLLEYTKVVKVDDCPSGYKVLDKDPDFEGDCLCHDIVTSCDKLDEIISSTCSATDICVNVGSISYKNKYDSEKATMSTFAEKDCKGDEVALEFECDVCVEETLFGEKVATVFLCGSEMTAILLLIAFLFFLF